MVHFASEFIAMTWLQSTWQSRLQQRPCVVAGGLQVEYLWDARSTKAISESARVRFLADNPIGSVSAAVKLAVSGPLVKLRHYRSLRRAEAVKRAVRRVEIRNLDEQPWSLCVHNGHSRSEEHTSELQ